MSRKKVIIVNNLLGYYGAENVPDGSVVAGNPAKVICSTEDYLKRHKEAMLNKPVFHKAWELSDAEKNKAREEIAKSKGGYDL